MAINKEFKPVPGSERTPLKHAKEVGAADPNEVVEITVLLRAKGSDAGAASIREMMTQPLKERTHLSREELAAINAPAPDDITKVEKFAQEYGLTIDKVSPEIRSVFLSGTVAALSAAFGTKLSMYDSPRGKYRGRVGPVQVPADLAEIIIGVFGLDNRPVARHHSIRLKQEAITQAQATESNAPPYTPLHLASHYNFPAGLDGSGQCIGIIEFGGGYTAEDMEAYFSGIGTTLPEIVTVPFTHSALNDPGKKADDDGEVALDIEVAGAVAPKAKIAVYFGHNTQKGWIDAINAAISDSTNRPLVISISWGGSEDGGGWTTQGIQSIESIFQLAVKGYITVFSSSGDDGSRNNENDGHAHVNYPASSCYVTGCGGTSLDPSGGETVWNDGPEGGATGGGVSEIFFPVPSWQSSVNVPPNANPGGHAGRGVPDVAADADPNTGYSTLLHGQWGGVGGTSAVAPLWAGLTALINQKLGKPVGWLNQLLYKNYETLVQSGAFKYVTDGNNGYSNYGLPNPYYTAGPGWNPCTGLGTPNGTALLQALSNL